jgi:hypothetical protein
MSFAPPFDPLLLLLDDPALLAALLAPPEPGLAAPVAGPATTPPPTREGAAPPAPPPPVLGAADAADAPEEAFPSLDDLDALLAQSYLAQDGPDLELRRDLAAELGLDPGLPADEAAFMAALAALEPPPPEDLPEILSGEAPWDPSWSEPVREDWPLG